MQKEQALLTPQEDEKLVRAFLAGDAPAFDALVIKYKDMVYTMCYYLLGDIHEANDYSQETFLKVYKSLPAFRFESSFSTWLYRIAVNTCKNRLNSLSYRFRKRLVSLHDPDESGNPVLQIPDESPLPNGRMEKAEKILQVRKAIKQLSPDHKTAIVLRDIKGLSYEEIALITGTDLGTVKSRISRARQELKSKLKGHA